MFGSKNNFFNKSRFKIQKYRNQLIELLNIRARNQDDINQYLLAYDYFTVRPFAYDGATIVKDLNDLPNLDIDAMLHDYWYLTGANRSFKRKWIADYKYIRNMEKNGKGIRVFRLLLLTISGLIFVPYVLIFRKK